MSQVISPHKVGEGMSSYMVYNVKTRTNINYFKKKEMSVNRRFSDFLGLHDKLSEKYLQVGLYLKKNQLESNILAIKKPIKSCNSSLE